MYRKQGDSKFTTREIAALDFLLNIPLEAEVDIVLKGLEAEVDKGLNTGANLGVDVALSDDEGLTVTNTVSAGKGGWWDSIAKSSKKFKAEGDEILKKQKQLELETELLELPEANNPDGQGDIKKQEARSRRGSFADSSLNVSNAPSSIGRKKEANMNFIPGRRLDGQEAIHVHIPRQAKELGVKTRHRTVALKFQEKEWERSMVHSIGDSTNILDGRSFLSSKLSYPVGIFSIIKYDQKNEEEIRRRQKLEALGGGGSQFVIPSRDWRGVSYRYLFPRRQKKNKVFNRHMEIAQRRCKENFEKMRQLMKDESNEKNEYFHFEFDMSSSDNDDEEKLARRSDNLGDDSDYEFSSVEKDPEEDQSSNMEDSDNYEDDLSSSSDDDSITYEPGFLDDPDMKKGKHRTQMRGDKITGCIASSIIHYVHPADLKADLNRQFRQRFDGWEPPKSRRKYIGARVVDGTYRLLDMSTLELGMENEDDGSVSDDSGTKRDGRRRLSSITGEFDNIRIPPSLTLSKIRSLKQTALTACIKAKIEVSTVALASVYFERLALDCRVDKSNRRLTFATCLLLAIKFNSESNVHLVHEDSEQDSEQGGARILKAIIKPRKDSEFWEPLFIFFTQSWGLSLKSIFAAEFGVFAALDFRLQASPSQVSFHFKRLMKSLHWNSVDYLNKEMYVYWQEALEDEENRGRQHVRRRELREKLKDQRILKLQRQLQQKEKAEFSSFRDLNPADDDISTSEHEPLPTTVEEPKNTSRSSSPKGKLKSSIFSRLGRMKRMSNGDLPKAEKKEVSFHRAMSSPNLSMQEMEEVAKLPINETVHTVGAIGHR